LDDPIDFCTFQPEISQYAAELLPVLFEYLGQVYAQMEKEKSESASLDRLFYALETFCENLDEGLMPYLPTLMDRLFVALDPNGWSMQLKRIALSTLGSAASAVKEGLFPYFQKIIELLNLYINADPNSEIHQLQSYAIGRECPSQLLKLSVIDCRRCRGFSCDRTIYRSGQFQTVGGGIPTTWFEDSAGHGRSGCQKERIRAVCGAGNRHERRDQSGFAKNSRANDQ
jgi:hypothetical protein